MAAGHPEAAISVLSSVNPGASVDAVRLWVTEQMAYSHVLQGASTLAKREYATLVATGYPAFQDIGVAGLIDLELADGKGDAAMAAYQATFAGRAAPGMMSAFRVADWLQKRDRVPESVEVLSRLSESGWAQDSERAWALLQLQSLYQRTGDIEKAVATGWRLQALAPPGDPSGEAGLKMLISAMASERAASSAGALFSETYRRFLDANPGALDPARQIVYAAELRTERKSDAAAALYEDVSRETSARRTDRAAAMLGLQRLRLESGQLDQSVQTGMAIHENFSQDLGSRVASWQLMRAACAESGAPNSLRRQAENLGRALAEDLRSSAHGSTDTVKRRAQALLLQFNKELNQQ